MRWPTWLPRVIVESALIVFSVLVALAVDEWRATRATEARAREAVAAITAELQANRSATERARDFHRGIHATLDGFAGFIVLTTDFVNREEALPGRYDQALATLASLTR